MQPQAPAPEQQPSQPEPQAQPLDSAPAPVDPSKPQEHNWEASEYIYHEKPAMWYVGLWLIAAALAGGFAFFQQWLSIAVVVVMVLAVTVYSRKHPRTLPYQLNAEGVLVQGQLTPYSSFKSYSVHADMAWHSLDLEPTKRFVPRLTLICEDDDIEIIDQIIGQHLPRVDREQDWIDRLARYLRF